MIIKNLHQKLRVQLQIELHQITLAFLVI